MSVGKIYRCLFLWDVGSHGTHPLSQFRFCESRPSWTNEGFEVELENFSTEGKLDQRDVLEMIYPGYPWDLIIKLYNEAPRSQK